MKNRSRITKSKSEKDPELQEIKTELDAFWKRVQKDVANGRKDEQQAEETKKCIGNLKKELQEKFKKGDWKETLHAFRREHRFLSQQIDERMHQMWTLGALFVPISFLIFAQAVVYPIGLFNGVLVGVASLVCYQIWYKIYMRSRALTKLSYPRIHVLEHVLYRQHSEDSYFHGHMYLDYLTDEYKIGTSPPKFFKWGRRILVGLWVVYLAVPVILILIATAFHLSIAA